MRVAVAAYPIDWLNDWAAYEAKIGRWVDEAVASGAELLVFPEYGAMELASLFGKEIASDLVRQIDAISALCPRVDALHAALAQDRNCHIVAATLPVRVEAGKAVNRARLFAPSGAVGVQDKLIMTRFEREDWKISGGRGAHVFDTALGKIGIAICYDAEFPLIARTMAEAGADLIAVPSCTDTEAGYARVRIGAMARALENQLYTLHAPTVGGAPWSPAVDVNIGAGGIYGPPDRSTISSGVVTEGVMNAPGWTYADLDLGALRTVRKSGEVLNARDWGQQTPGLGGPAAVTSLR